MLNIVILQDLENVSANVNTKDGNSVSDVRIALCSRACVVKC